MIPGVGGWGAGVAVEACYYGEVIKGESRDLRKVVYNARDCLRNSVQRGLTFSFSVKREHEHAFVHALECFYFEVLRNHNDNKPQIMFPTVPNPHTQIPTAANKRICNILCGPQANGGALRKGQSRFGLVLSDAVGRKPRKWGAATPTAFFKRF